MRREIRAWLLAGAALAAMGCRKGERTPAAAPTPPPVAAPPAAPAPPSIGMADPFARLGADAARSLAAGYKALRAKRFDEARAAFSEVVKAAPDHATARYQEVRAAALSGHFADVPALWADLLARDCVAYAGRLDKPKELAPLRASPEWAKVKQIEAAAMQRYAVGLDKGFFFVARARDAAPAKAGADGVTKIDLQQEAWHFDPATQRYRRLTNTDGHVFAIAPSPDRRTLSFLVVSTLKAGAGAPSFLDAQAGSIDLTTLAATGPFPMAGEAPGFVLAFGAHGEPLWQGATPGKAWTFDTARTTLVEIAVDLKPEAPGTTRAVADEVRHFGGGAAGVKVAPDGASVEVAGIAEPLRAARPISTATLEWSPGHKRLTYAGAISPCKILKQGKPMKDDRNELFVYDVEKKSAQRVAQAVSSFGALWLDEDHLVFEGGVGREGRLHVFDLSTRNDVVLTPRFGAGLFGYPELRCDGPEDGWGSERSERGTHPPAGTQAAPAESGEPVEGDDGGVP